MIKNLHFPSLTRLFFVFKVSRQNIKVLKQRLSSQRLLRRKDCLSGKGENRWQKRLELQCLC